MINKSINIIRLINQKIGYLFFRLNNNMHNKHNLELLYEFNKNRPLGPRKIFCFSPFNSMFFDQYGRVRPCWDIINNYDKYPNKSLKEIWNGENYEKLRESFSKNVLSSSCNTCINSIQNKNFNAVKAKKYDNYPINKKHFPTYMEFVCENTCNLECTMCNGSLSSSIRNKRDHLLPLHSPYDNNFIEQLKEFIPHLKVASFIGGEPFLIKTYYSIWEQFVKLNPNISVFITTNAAVLNDKIKDILSKGKFSFNISIDSLNKKVYENIRKNSMFEQVKENIDWLYKYTLSKSTTFNINMCIIRENWKEVPEMIIYCNKLGCTIFFCDVIQPFEHAIWTLKYAELEKIFKHLSTFTFENNTNNEQINNKQFTAYINKLKIWLKIAKINENNLQEDILTKNEASILITNKFSSIITNNNKLNLFSTKIDEIINKVPEKFFTKYLIDKLFETNDDYVISSFINENAETIIDFLIVLKYNKLMRNINV